MGEDGNSLFAASMVAAHFHVTLQHGVMGMCNNNDSCEIISLINTNYRQTHCHFHDNTLQLVLIRLRIYYTFYFITLEI